MENKQIILGLEEVEPVSGLLFEPLDRKYRSAHILGTAIAYVLLMALALLLLLTDPIWAFIAVECAIAVTGAANIAMLKKACAFKGYALRDHDISYRTGIIFPKITTIPYSRVQQVSVRQNPVSRLYGLYSVDIVNGAQQLSSMAIPGLTKETATRIKELIAEKS